MEKKGKVCAIGRTAQLPFQQIGVTCFKPEENLIHQINVCSKEGYGIFYIEESLLQEEILIYFDRHPYVTVVAIPGQQGEKLGSKRLDQLVERALGQKII